MLKAVVIGCGSIGSLYDEGRQALDPHSHAGAYASHPLISLRAGADIDPVRRDRFASMWNVPVYEDYREMLAVEKPDLVSVCTWADSHREIVVCAVEAGARAVFCEKPLADSLASARRLVEICEARGVPLAVNHLRRWDTAHQQIRDFLTRGELGEVQHVTVHYVRGIANSGSHIADLLRFFFGEVAWVWVRDRLREDEIDRSVDGYIAMQNGVGCALVGCARGNYDLFDWDIVGTRGRLRIENLGYVSRLWRIDAHKEFPGVPILAEVPSPFPPGMRGVMVAAVDNLIRNLIAGEPLLDSGQDGLAALEIVTALQESAASGGRQIEFLRSKLE